MRVDIVDCYGDNGIIHIYHAPPLSLLFNTYDVR